MYSKKFKKNSYVFVFILMGLFISSCRGPRYLEYFPYFDDGTKKPVVLLLPVQDRVQMAWDWSPPQSFTNQLRYQFLVDEVFYVVSEEKTQEILEQFQDKNFFSSDLSFTKRFQGIDYVVALELIGHKISSEKDPGYGQTYPKSAFPCSQLLSFDIKVRLIDLRKETPRIILQEVFSRHHQVKTKFDKGQGIGYDSLAKERTCRDLAKRIEYFVGSCR